MRKAVRESNGVRMMNLQQACEYTGMGVTFLRKWAGEIGATRVFSARMTRYDKTVIDAALDKMKEESTDKIANNVSYAPKQA